MIIKPVYKHGDVVYLVSDPEQYRRVITAFVVYPDHLEYTLACGTDNTDHKVCEISADKNVM